MSDMMTFPETWEEFEKSYGFADSEEVYTNGSRLIPSFRVKQWLDHEESKRETKQQATVSSDCISRQSAIDVEGLDEQIRCEMCRNPMHTNRGCDGNCKYDEKLYKRIMQILGERIKPLPSAEPNRASCKQVTGKLGSINRQDAIDAINAYLGLSAVSRTIQNMTSIQEILENLPSAEPEYKELQDWKTDFKGFIDALDMPRDDYCGIMEYIDEVPFAEPRKKGKWIYGEKSGQDGWYCSECGGFIPWYYDFYGLDNIDFIENFKTCPFCDSKIVSYTGAGMREGEEE